jgi:hypothetical protein
VIVTRAGAAQQAAAKARPASPAGITCLARRGMLHAECEAYDHVALGPGEIFAPPGVHGTESALYIVSGAAQLLDHDEGAEGAGVIRAGDVILCPLGTRPRLTAFGAGCALLWLQLLPDQISRLLPARRPELADRDRPGGR